MPRVFIGVIAESRVNISFAALLVNVTASMDIGLAWPVARSHAMRVVRTRVLPLPAPARMSAEACGSVTAASCSGFRLARSGDDIDWGWERRPYTATTWRAEIGESRAFNYRRREPQPAGSHDCGAI